MSKLGNNPIMKGASGMLGDVVVYRQQNGKVVMSNRPKKRSMLTDHQKQVKAKFLQAVQYAKGQMLDPNAKAEYETGKTENLISAYGVAVTDFLRSPEVTSIDAAGYQGFAGNAISLIAIDDFKVTNVSVEIRSAADAMIEQGYAVQDAANNLAWTYTTTAVNSNLPGTRVIVRAKDKPGNIGEKELVL